MTFGVNKQCPKSKVKEKKGAAQTRISKKNEIRIRCHGGVSILCQPVTYAVCSLSKSRKQKICRQQGE